VVFDVGSTDFLARSIFLRLVRFDIRVVYSTETSSLAELGINTEGYSSCHLFLCAVLGRVE